MRDITLMISVVLGLFLFLLILTFMAIYILLNRNVLRRFDIIKMNLNEIGKMNFDNQIEVSGNDEISEIIDNINNLADNLDKKIKEQNKLIFALSHEKKTPLAKIDASMYLHAHDDSKYQDRKDVYEIINDEITNLMQSINTMLLALDNVETNKKTELINFTRLIEKIIDDNETIIDKKNLLIDMDEADYMVNINRQLTEIILKNIISNALKYSSYDSVINIYYLEQRCIIENEIITNPEKTSTKIGNKINDYLAESIGISIHNYILSGKYVTVISLKGEV